jgi:hypothetical protein
MNLPVAPLELTPRQQLLQLAHVLQATLFPRLEQELGPLGPAAKLLIEVLAAVPLSGAQTRRQFGRPSKDRHALAAAFLAKAVYGFTTTRQLRAQLQVDHQMRRCCGWKNASQLPHEATFSRAFAEFARTELAQQLHASLIEKTQGARLIGHISRDSTAIEVRERLPQKARTKKKPKTRRKARRTKASERGTVLQRQRSMSLAQMLAQLPSGCAGSMKQSSKGQPYYWRGYKLHLAVADAQIPISAILTAANVHDVNVAIPLMTMSQQRVTWLYDLMDSAYDANALLAHVRQQNHVPIVDRIRAAMASPDPNYPSSHRLPSWHPN